MATVVRLAALDDGLLYRLMQIHLQLDYSAAWPGRQCALNLQFFNAKPQMRYTRQLSRKTRADARRI